MLHIFDFLEERHKIPSFYKILEFEKLDLIKLLIELCVYKHPDRYAMPKEFVFRSIFPFIKFEAIILLIVTHHRN